MQTRVQYKRITSYLAAHRNVRAMLIQCSLFVVVLAMIGGGILTATYAHAASYCASGDALYVVRSGDTLGLIAYRYHTTYQRLQAYNKIENANLIFVDQHICIPSANTVTPVPVPQTPTMAHGTSDVFPYPSCTWWASLRYAQLHGFYVPWTTNSNAWQWSDRARDFHWQVSLQPHVGAIVDLQPYVQGAYGLGHVAVVERVMGNGYFVSSSTNWGLYPYSVTDVTMHTGYGVTFIG